MLYCRMISDNMRISDGDHRPERLRLRYSGVSPFVRKVRVAAAEVGLSERIELIPCDVWAPDSDIVHDNPLGKVPALISSEGTFIGSTLCCEYLDSLHEGTKLIPVAREPRFRVWRRHALADGIMEAGVAHVTEAMRRPPEFVYAGFLARQRQKIQSTLHVIEADLPAWGEDIDIASVTLACTLGYLDFRLPALQWRHRHPNIAAWNAIWAERASMLATRPSLD
jgi:glutathione S-transferase